MCCTCKEEKARTDAFFDSCVDTQEARDSYGDTCYSYIDNTEWCGGYDDEDFNAFEDCCACKALSEEEKAEVLAGDFDNDDDFYYPA